MLRMDVLDPTVGREIQKTRPALIIQNDISNRLSHIAIVATITSTVQFPLNPVHVLLATDHTTGQSVTSVALFNQITHGRLHPFHQTPWQG
jgi:mRNA interferase MazF